MNELILYGVLKYPFTNCKSFVVDILTLWLNVLPKCTPGVSGYSTEPEVTYKPYELVESWILWFVI